MRLVFLLLAFCLVACCAPKTPTRPYDVGALLTFHASADFVDYQRRWLNEAADNLNRQTAGIVEVHYVYDVDPETSDTVFAQGDDMLLLADPSGSLVTEFDSQHCCLLGLTLPSPDDSQRGTIVMLVTDRLQLHDRFVSVAMHEFLHAAGLRHVKSDERALMYPVETDETTMCLRRSDVVELCRRYGCNIDRVGWCN